ncbi:hydroxymethylbilane synthase [Zhouia amylolytica]|uniref:Hydroxymethylbilane synthase n=1 Tax=Zhouia amylolytica AD3 TaxID=1286632 RepID=W2UJN9_9FLAO|nr:hydroxymethylbilane synthase [Zhouia amylolytica]ETN94218.1 porphobilinogen deaminase [Zhouia amylolytica AD3]MCQ0111484.1 hydroxymethylbilane synthase [Zhouia amylolytica]
MNKVIRIGTRDSELALWQANTVKKKLEDLGYKTELTPVKSTGDLILDKPLYELGITGVFTKTLDIAMINGTIDIAVHSMKDVPTMLPKGIIQGAVLERANVEDLLIHKGNTDFLSEEHGVIATGSLRRKAQWLHKYPSHTVVGLRGNVNSRMQKLHDNNWNGAIFAKAGLERIALKPENNTVLDWMIPAPAQGAITIAVMENNPYVQEAVAQLNHIETEICTKIERDFLRTLEGGCSAPIGALATIDNNTIHFNAAVFSLDGSQKAAVNTSFPLKDHLNKGISFGQQVLNEGGKSIMEEIRKTIN